jgi:glycosyltransferase involved in cell wall biosynthesis
LQAHSPPIRVVHIITGLAVGGAEKMLCRLAAGFDRRAIETTVISLTEPGALGDEIERSGARLVSLGMTPGRLNVSQLLMLRRTLRHLAPDIVQTWLYHADLAGLIAARLAGTRAVVWNIRCADIDDADRSLSLRVLQRVLALLSPLPRGVISNSHAGREAHERLGYHPRQWHIIPNAVDTDQYRPDPAARGELLREFGLDPSCRLVGIVGRSHPMKDHQTFLKAAAIVARSCANTRFILVGRDISSNAELQQLASAVGTGREVIMTGERADIARLLSGFDVAVSSSYSEGFPNVVVEAMACGTPVVVTEVGDSASIVGDCGIVCPPRDPAALADGILKVLRLSSAERTSMIDRARQRVLDNFALPAATASYSSLYRSLSGADR